MFRYIVLFSFVVAVIHANGRFTVLDCPKSLEFTGDEPLESSYAGDVLLAALGHSVAGPSKWTGMSIRDPFSLAQMAIVVILVKGAKNMSHPLEVISYELKGLEADNSLNYMISQLPKESVTNINLTNHKEGMDKFQSLFGTADVPTVHSLKALRPTQYWSHKHFIEEMGLLQLAMEKLDTIVKPSHVLIVSISLNPIVKVARDAAIDEAQLLLAKNIQLLLNSVHDRNESVLVVQITPSEDPDLVSKDHAGHKSGRTPFQKISKDPNFPVLLNIVTWFGVLLALSLSVICYAIATMDPGRDSVIYRVTTLKDSAKKKH